VYDLPGQSGAQGVDLSRDSRRVDDDNRIPGQVGDPGHEVLGDPFASRLGIETGSKALHRTSLECDPTFGQLFEQDACLQVDSAEAIVKPGRKSRLPGGHRAREHNYNAGHGGL